MKIRNLTTAALALSLGLSAHAAEETFNLYLSGDQEVSGGDLDAFGIGTITINDSTGLISWDIDYFNMLDPSAMHIHGPGGTPGVNAGVFVGLGVAGDFGADNLFGSTSTSTTNAAAILANPNSFYVNIHNSPHPGGAIRGQVVPEPGSAALLAIAGAGLLVRRRRRA